MHVTTSWRKRMVAVCAAALAVPLAFTAGTAGAAPAAQTPAATQVTPSTSVTVPAHQIEGQRWGMTIHSTAMNRDVPVQFLVPPGYNINGSTQYPEVYLLDGLRAPNDSSDWVNKGGAEQFFADKQVLAILSIGGGGTFFSDWKNPADAGVLALNGVPGSQLNWETFLTQELPPIVGSALHGNGSRAVEGLSMGGYAAFSLIARHKDLYRAAASFSGFPDTQAALLPQFLQYVLSDQIGATNSNDLWGDPNTDLLWPQHNPYVNAQAMAGKSLYMSAGTGGNGPYDTPLGFAGLSSNYVGAILEVVANYSSQSFAQLVPTVPGLNVTEDLNNPGVHDWPYWAPQLVKSWPQMSKAIGGPTGPACSVKGSIATLYYSNNTAVTPQPAFFSAAPPTGLGACTANEGPDSGAIGQTFQNGHIYCTCSDANTHAIQGAINGRYQAYGGPNSDLRFPISNEISLTAGKGARFSSFAFPNARGLAGIYYTYQYGLPQIVKGAIFDAWGDNGFENGKLGYPVTEERLVNGIIQQDFQGGNITFDGQRATVH